MIASFENKMSLKAQAEKLLDALKQKEQTFKMHKKHIEKCVVMCKNKEQFLEFEQAVSNPKMW